MKIENLKNVMLAAVLAASTLRCVGQGVAYTSRDAFDAAIAGLAGSRRDVDFQGELPPGGTDIGGTVRYFTPLTISGLTFQPGVLLVRSSLYGNRSLNNYDSLGSLAVDMNGPALVFGADFSSLLSPVYSIFLATVTLANGNMFSFTAPANTNSSFTATVSLGNGESFQFTAPTKPNSTFFGFISPSPVMDVTFSDGGLFPSGPANFHEEMIANLVMVLEVPEPGGIALLGFGAAVLYGWRLCRIRKG